MAYALISIDTSKFWLLNLFKNFIYPSDEKE
jgi:hypothetical protein